MINGRPAVVFLIRGKYDSPRFASGAKFSLINSPSSIDLISCDLQGRLMSGGDVMDSEANMSEESPDLENSAMEYLSLIHI